MEKKFSKEDVIEFIKTHKKEIILALIAGGIAGFIGLKIYDYKHEWIKVGTSLERRKDGKLDLYISNILRNGKAIPASCILWTDSEALEFAKEIVEMVKDHGIDGISHF